MAKEFQKQLVQILNEKGSMSTQELYSYFNDMNSKTVSWHLYNCLNQGLISRTMHGNYTLSSSIPEVEERLSHMPIRNCMIFDFMCKSGFDFYMTGLDGLNGIGFDVSGDYPVLLCCRKKDVKDVQIETMRQFDLTLTEFDTQMLSNEKTKRRIQYVILGSNDFSLQKNHFAFPEKAFIDLYYAVTRLDYPISIEELPHILSLIKPNSYRFKRATKDRKISHELDFLMNYNKDFIKALAEFIEL